LPSLFFSFFSLVLRLNILLKIPTAYNSGLAKAAIEICAKIKHPLGSLRQAAKRYLQGYDTAYNDIPIITKA
jgi:hypothetical protein